MCLDNKNVLLIEFQLLISGHLGSDGSAPELPTSVSLGLSKEVDIGGNPSYL